MHIITRKQVDDISREINNAQTQSQIANTLLSTPSVYGFVDTFTERHYQCRYTKDKAQWLNSKSKKPVDLNNAKTMALTALRYLSSVIG